MKLNPDSGFVKCWSNQSEVLSSPPAGAFLFCWTPFFVLHTMRARCQDCHVPPALMSVVTWLGYVNSALNPVIYTVFNTEFRKFFKKFLQRCCSKFTRWGQRCHRRWFFNAQQLKETLLTVDLVSVVCVCCYCFLPLWGFYFFTCDDSKVCLSFMFPAKRFQSEEQTVRRISNTSTSRHRQELILYVEIHLFRIKVFTKKSWLLRSLCLWSNAERTVVWSWLSILQPIMLPSLI